MNKNFSKSTLPWKPIKGEFQNLSGQRFGKLTVIKFCRQDKHRNKYWECKCDCGKTCTPQANSLRNGTSTSCGCGRVDALLKAVTRHGLSKSGVYAVWTAMKQRCLNPSNCNWKNYGGRGISLCERWASSFENFCKDMGPRPPGGTIERIDNSAGYCPENCRWATNREQSENKRTNHRLSYGGKEMLITHWAKSLGLANHTIITRLSRGWPIERALSSKNQRGW